MRRASLVLALVPLAGLLAWSYPVLGATASTAERACAALSQLSLPDVSISEAVAVPATPNAPVHVPHCRVTGIIGTEIGFVAVLPETWNGRFFMGGGGGYVGQIQNSALLTANLGYATSGTDTGHKGDGLDGSWAYRNVERQVNFGFAAVHRTAEVTKAIIGAHYGRPAEKSYFQGCSRGGGQALMAAQRFPRDFDGIVAGAPAYNWTGFAAASVRNMQALYPDPARLDARLFSPDDLKLLESRVVAACDKSDGVADGVIDDPRSCRFDVGSLPFTDAQKHALETIYSPTVAAGAVIYPAQPFGGEGQAAGWAPWITGAARNYPATGFPSLLFGFGTHVFKFFVFDDPTWNYRTYDLANWARDTARTATVLNATSPDLDAFKTRGGKLILWHGWSDPALTALASIEYHDEVHARDPQAASYMRTFLMPGVLHCGGGAGPDTVDWVEAISGWVERGTAPERVVARKVANGAVTRSRPLCPYPQKAVYRGSGSTDDETNFVCR